MLTCITETLRAIPRLRGVYARGHFLLRCSIWLGRVVFLLSQWMEQRNKTINHLLRYHMESLGDRSLCFQDWILLGIFHTDSSHRYQPPTRRDLQLFPLRPNGSTGVRRGEMTHNIAESCPTNKTPAGISKNRPPREEVFCGMRVFLQNLLTGLFSCNKESVVSC